MPRFRIHDVHSVEHSPTSPATLRNKVSEMIANSTLPCQDRSAEPGDRRVSRRAPGDARQGGKQVGVTPGPTKKAVGSWPDLPST